MEPPKKGKAEGMRYEGYLSRKEREGGESGRDVKVEEGKGLNYQCLTQYIRKKVKAVLNYP